jgi:predicted ArsR family transcriptional regulator
MKSTREKILISLLKNPKSTISDLAAVVNINAISVRHHISSLTADGLVTIEEERHGVGRPRLVYSLSQEGMEHFPTRYFRLTNRILNQVKDSLPPEKIGELFSDIAKDIAADHHQTLKSMDIEGKLTFIQNLLDEEGFFVEWEKKDDHYIIHEVSCPYFQVVQNHPEVCRLDQTLITEMLDIPANKMNCILDGDRRCSYLIPYNQKLEK